MLCVSGFGHPHVRTAIRLPNQRLFQKVEKHEADVALHFMFYNFARVHQTLRVTPAMEAGIADHVWSFAEIVNIIPN